MIEQEIQQLALKFFRGETTPEEEIRLHQWYARKGGDDDELTVDTDGESASDIKNRLLGQLQTKLSDASGAHRYQRTRRSIRFIYSAAAILLIATAGLYFYQQRPDEIEHYTKLLPNDVGPGGDNAVLELADGSSINLDQATASDLAGLNGIVVSKKANGVLAIEMAETAVDARNQLNTIRTPQGGQYQIELPDNTRVWLNASSILKFPGAFTGGTREVELEGEAYFEVAPVENTHRQRIPFIVKSRRQRVEVLGTHFNISSYPDENISETTLIEGSVRVYAAHSAAGSMLAPGQQSLLTNGRLTVDNADIESVMAWKNGDFIFNNEPLTSIMNKIARWYDVEVVYQHPPEGYRFSGAISRSNNLSAVLNIMELTGRVTFKIEGRRVTVMT